MSALPPPDWLPIRVYRSGATVLVDWCAFDWTQAVNPFFDQSVEHTLLHPFNAAFRVQTPVDVLAELDDSRSPSGLIFHMSRCGSTLLVRMLQTLNRCRVISEAGAITMLLQHTATRPEAERATLLRGLLAAYARSHPHEEPPRTFFKLDPWQTCDLPLFRRAFPNVPWLFVYRDPLEVLVSQMYTPASTMISRFEHTAQLGLDAATATALPLQEFVARALGTYCQHALKQLDSCGALLHYRQLPDAAFTLLPRSFGVEWMPTEGLHARRATQFHAKQPATLFSDDTAAKQRAATLAMRDVVERWARGPYNDLVAAHQRLSEHAREKYQ